METPMNLLFRTAALAALTFAMTVAGPVGCASDNGSRSMDADRASAEEPEGHVGGARAREPEGRGTRSPIWPQDENGGDNRRVMFAAYQPDVPDGYSAAGLAFPTGDPASSALLVHQVLPHEVRTGQAFDFQYHVTNMTGGTLQNVVLMNESVDNMEILESDPSFRDTADGMLWNLGDLGPNETQVIDVRAEAGDPGSATGCISVSYNNVLCHTLAIVEPALELVKTTTSESLLCDTFTYTYRVTNTGTGIATGVVIEDRFDECIRTVDGADSISLPVGDLAAGQTAERTITVEATCRGDFGSAAMAESTNGLSAESDEPETAIVQPELAIMIECPERRYIGRNVEFVYTVENTGDATSNNTILTAQLPENVEFVRASVNAAPTGNQISWNLGALPPGEERTVSAVVRSMGLATLRTTARVSGVCAEEATADCTTEVEGIPAVLLEVVDARDPIEVGETVTYIIRVTNQGSANDTDIRIVATLPPQQEFVNAGGAARAEQRGREIVFQPYEVLRPGQVIEYQVVARAVDTGDVRFAVEMTTNQLTEPVNETEATNLYE
jgi:uncharacterized repeat protein (TIGR01451 family)